MTFETILKDAVRNAIGATIAAEVQDIVAKETRRALHEHEDELTRIIRAAVHEAVADILNPDKDQ